MLSANWTSVTTCADDAVRPCARSTALCRTLTAASSDHAPERRAPRAGEPVRRPESVDCGLHVSQGISRPGEEPAGITRLDDRDRLDPAAQVLTEYRPDVVAGGSAARELPVHEKDARSSA